MEVKQPKARPIDIRQANKRGVCSRPIRRAKRDNSIILETTLSKIKTQQKAIRFKKYKQELQKKKDA